MSTALANVFKLSSYGSVLDKMTGGQVRDVLSRTGAVDVSQAVIAAAQSYRRVRMPRGVYRMSELAFSALNNTVLEGDGDFDGGTVLLFDGGASSSMLTFSNCQHAGLLNLYIKPAKRMTGGYAVRFTGGSFKCFAEKVRVDYGWNGVDVNGATETRISSLQLRQMHGTNGLRFTGSAAQPSYRCTVNDFAADNPYPLAHGAVISWTPGLLVTAGQIMANNGLVFQCVQSGVTGGGAPSAIPGSGAPDAFTTRITDGSAAWRFVCRATLLWTLQDSFGYSLVINQAAVIGGGTGFRQDDTAGAGSSYPTWAWLWDFESDHPFNDCMQLAKGEGVYVDSGWLSSSLQGRGIVIDATHRGEITVDSGTRIFGNFKDGVLHNGGSNFKLTDSFIGANSQEANGAYHGVSVGPNVTNFEIGSNRIGDLSSGVNRQGYGIFLNAGCDHYTITDNNLRGNITGPMTGHAAGTVKHVENNVPLQVRARGTVTISAGQTTGVFAHGLGAAPARVLATPRADLGLGKRWWVTVNSTQVIVNADSAVAADTAFDVIAETT